MHVFVMMPFSEDFSEVRASIRSAIAATGAGCILADEISEAGSITAQMLAAIRSAAVCVYDITGRNPNVAWEAGFAHALEKPVFVVSGSSENLFFDMKDQRAIIYDRTNLQNTLTAPLQVALLNSQRLVRRVPPELLVGTFDHEKTSLVLAATGISETKYGFFDLLRVARRQVFVAAQNHFYFVENEDRRLRFKTEVHSFLTKDRSRRVELLMCRDDDVHAVATWKYVTVDRYEDDLSKATAFFRSVGDWLNQTGDVGSRFQVRAVAFVPVSMTFVDPDESDGFLVFTPNVFEAKNRARACFVLSRSKNPEIFKQYWAAYQLRFYDGKLLHASAA